ncbi:MAG: carbohydrate ABC transporter permease [Bacillota bacterium]|nr:carbohydrate ABC transporter permease [Bacillota bacterium]
MANEAVKIKTNRQVSLNRGKNFSSSRIFLYVGLIVLALICFIPFYMMLINATHSSYDIGAKINLLPSDQLIANYKVIMKNTPRYWYGFQNSVIISVFGTLLSAYFGSLAAYGFAKYKFRGKNILFWAVMATMMIPPQLGIIGFYQLMNAMHLISNPLALILPMAANANLVFFVRGYIEGAISNSLIESARMDGCGEFKIFNRIVLPLITPSIATMSIFTFITSWNNFFTPLVIMQREDRYTVPIMTYMVNGFYRDQFGAVYTSLAISVVPIMIVFIFASKYIIGGLTAGAVKG